MDTNPSNDPDTNTSPIEAADTPKAARAWLEGGLVRQKLVGGQTRESVDELTRQTEPIVEQLQAKEEPVLILSDYTEVTAADQGSREELRKVLGTRYFDRIAVFGVPTALRIVGELLLKMTGKKDQVQIFDTKEAAEAWLREFSK